MPDLHVYQSLWATQLQRAGVAEKSVEERFAAIREARYDGVALDLGALEPGGARACVPLYARFNLRGLLIAYPASIAALRPALHLAKDIGAPFVIVVGQLMPVALDDMVPIIEGWLRIAAEERVPIQFETHRHSITSNLFATLQLLNQIPDMRLSADLSHYVVERAMRQPIDERMQGHISRILARSASFQGRIGTGHQVQVPLDFPQHRAWLETFTRWWREGFASFVERAPDQDLAFICELGPPGYAMTDAQGRELSDRAKEALVLASRARELWGALTRD